MATTRTVREKSKKPTKLGIERIGTKFRFTWTIGDKDYNFGEYFDWRIKINNSWSAWSGNYWKKGGKTAKNIDLNDHYYVAPADVDPIYDSGAGFDWKYQEIEFRVMGCRDGYTTSKGKGKNKVTTIHGTYYSDYAYKSHTIYAPKAPTCTVTLNDAAKATFAWKVESAGEGDWTWFSKIHWQSILRVDETENAGPGIAWAFHDGTLGWQEGESTSTEGSKPFPETTGTLPGWLSDDTSYTRWFRIRSAGPGGYSGWAYYKQVYAKPYSASISSPKATKVGTGMDVSVNWRAISSSAHPIDKDILEYLIAKPVGPSLQPPNEGWTTAPRGEIEHNTNAGYTLGFRLDKTPGIDECLWVRVVTDHDGSTNVSAQLRAPSVDGDLATPTNLRVSDNYLTHTATISADNNSEVPGAFMAVQFTSTEAFSKGRIIAIIPNGESSVTVTYPGVDEETENYSFAVKAVYGTPYGSAGYYSLDEIMSSPYLTDGGDVPSIPRGVTVSEVEDIDGTVKVSWNWNWPDATRAELSWADHEDAWNSTSEPSKYLVPTIYEPQWNISGLETGKKWYVRVRFAGGDESNPIYGPYSKIQRGIVDLATVPSTPFLLLSKDIVTVGDSLKASWGYSSSDDTRQASAIVAEVIDVDGEKEYKKIAIVETQQHVVIDIATMTDWSTGSTHRLAVQVTSSSGKISEWSNAVLVTFAEPIEADITASTLVEKTEIWDEDTGETRTITALTAMPIKLTVTGAGSSGTTTVSLVRAESYPVLRPDAEEWVGVEGEVVAIKSQMGESEITIEERDLVGRLDDGGLYYLIASVQDTVGQLSETQIMFKVDWDIQAVPPEAEITMDDDNLVAIFKPKAPKRTPAELLAGATCDVYRLSSDRPELIYENALFGTTYVDPYPTIGDFGGYRFVFKTVNGDYTTADNHLAITDYETLVDTFYNIIDFGQDRVLLLYNVDLSSEWKKDFKETHYLGGSIQGDWNPAVSRTATVNGVVIKAEDQNTIEAMRRLAEYPGHCHVRTIDGSSYTADIQVSESRGHEPSDLTVDFSLSITRIESVNPDAMTYEEWQEMQPEVE